MSALAKLMTEIIVGSFGTIIHQTLHYLGWFILLVLIVGGLITLGVRAFVRLVE